jgi:hypothetical protein
VTVAIGVIVDCPELLEVIHLAVSPSREFGGDGKKLAVLGDKSCLVAQRLPMLRDVLNWGNWLETDLN